MDDLSIVPVEVLSMTCEQGGVQYMQRPVGSSGNSHLHQAWQLAVTSLETPYQEFSLRDVQHIKKFRNLEHIAARYRSTCSSLPGWHLVSQVALALSKLRSIDLRGPSSFELLKVLQGSEQLQQRIYKLQLRHVSHIMTATDLYCLAGMKALAELVLSCKALQGGSNEVLGVASQALAKTLDSLSLYIITCPGPSELHIFPGSITSLKKLDLSSDDSSGHGKALAAAVSSLVGLQELELESMGDWTAETQQQALGSMTRLTSLVLQGSSAPLAVVPSVATLQKLQLQDQHIQGTAADAVLSMAALRHVTALSFQPSVAWRGQVAAHCGIQELQLYAGQADEDLRNLPRLPHLKHFVLVYEELSELLSPSDGRYLHLARLLQRHAATVEHVIVGTLEQVREALPDLPVCKVLMLEQAAMGAATLQALSGIDMPLLEHLYLGGCFAPEVEQSELAWLVQLPALRKVEIAGADADGHEEAMDMARSLLESKPWVEVL